MNFTSEKNTSSGYPKIRLESKEIFREGETADRQVPSRFKGPIRSAFMLKIHDLYDTA